MVFYYRTQNSFIHAKFALEHSDKIKVIDVRDISSYEEKHIPNAINIPFDALLENIHNTCPDKDMTIYVYCSKGVNSQKSCRILVDNGYKNVYNTGAIDDWFALEQEGAIYD